MEKYQKILWEKTDLEPPMKKVILGKPLSQKAIKRLELIELKDNGMLFYLNSDIGKDFESFVEKNVEYSKFVVDDEMYDYLFGFSSLNTTDRDGAIHSIEKINPRVRIKKAKIE